MSNVMSAFATRLHNFLSIYFCWKWNCEQVLWICIALVSNGRWNVWRALVMGWVLCGAAVWCCCVVMLCGDALWCCVVLLCAAAGCYVVLCGDGVSAVCCCCVLLCGAVWWLGECFVMLHWFCHLFHFLYFIHILIFTLCLVVARIGTRSSSIFKCVHSIDLIFCVYALIIMCSNTEFCLVKLFKHLCA